MNRFNRALKIPLVSFWLRLLPTLLLATLLSPALLLAEDSQPRAAEDADCAVEIQVVGQDSPRQRMEICQGAREALVFLANYGVTPTGSIQIEVVDSPQEHNGGAAFGSYDRRTGRISLMSMAAISGLEETPKMLGQAMDYEHFRAGVAHEIAHALFHQNGPDAQLSNAAQEYLAYATQLAVLPEPQRRQLIESADVSAWQSGDTISEVYMAFAPEKFAVKSYLHFIQMSDPQAFVKTLLNVKWFYVDVP
ncbi:DUF6639 family protein [Marinobacterium mangrovicola]|uniref:DUF6639 family protein n=1 Tax=Marinobacterium mangrovicola TaxID=1476959 RepID=UPI00311ED4B5